MLAALCIYTHIFALLVLTAHALAIVFPKPFRVELPTVVASAAVFALLCEPMAAFVVLQHSDQLAWMARPTLADVWQFLTLLTSQGGVLLVIIYLGLCGMAFLQPAGVKRPAKESWALRLMLFWLLSLPLLTLAVSLIKPFFYPRYMVICVPALVILAARGLVKLYDLPGVEALGCGWSFRSGDRIVGVGHVSVLREFSDREQRLALCRAVHLAARAAWRWGRILSAEYVLLSLLHSPR